MKSYSATWVVAFASVACLAGAAWAAPITKAVQAACKNDYKNYCGEYGLETAALRSCMDRNGHKLSKTCDSVLTASFESEDGDIIEKRFLGLVLIMRYFKRVNAHLKNSATSVINPFHEIGFRPGAI